MIATTWQDIAAGFKAQLNARLPKGLPTEFDQDVSGLVRESSLLTSVEKEIVRLDATDLCRCVREKQYTAVAITAAYLKAAALAHAATNCLMDYFPEEALARAQFLDDELERTGKTVGPLHGLPVSVKDHLGLAGHEITAGFASWVGKQIPDKDGTYVSILRDAGAVFYVKTTNPQAIMHLETDSFLGPTLNPFNRKLTCGGSSGGEGALIGAGGSPLGIGTDIGGSIRNPAALCGIYGFKPTSTRLPKGGNKAEMVGQEAIAGAIGPMARSARDLSLSVETILSAEPWLLDSSQVGMKWRPEEVRWKGVKPRIGVMWDDGVVVPQAATRNALSAAVDKLRQQGFEVVDYHAYKQAEAWDLITSLFFTDGAKRVQRAIDSTGEPWLPLTKWIVGLNTKPRSSEEVFELVKRREAFRAAYNAHFQSYDIDVILCPPAPGPAPVLGTSRYWGYTSVFNLVDYPSAVLPTGTFVSASDVREPERAFLSDDDCNVWRAYDPKVMHGAPLALQIVASRWEDEKVLLALELIDAALTITC